jgi:tetratricopeptide (TPR) repeat protein
MLRPRRLPTYALLLGLFTLFAASPALAQKDPRTEAKAHYANGKKLYEQGQYTQAIDEFRTADQLAPSGVNDFNIALCYESLGQPGDAAKHYRAYLDRMPDASNRAAVQESITRLDAEALAQQQKAAEDDRARRADEEARRIEEEQRAKAGGGATAPAATGDPELDRVAAIDVNAVRDERRLAPVGGANAAGGGPAVPPPQGGAPVPVGGEPTPKKSKPVYKQWWFWVVVGVSAYVLITILADSSSSDTQARQLDMPDMPSPAAPSGGFNVLHF